MNLPLKDIKPNTVIIDYEWYIFLSVIGILLILLILIGYKFFIKRKDNKKLMLEKLKNLPLEDSKKTAYTFCKIARNFLNENNKKLFLEIEKELEIYKYRPQVPPLDKKTIEKISEFIKGIK